MEALGLIAGNGQLPEIFLRRARERGIPVHTLAVRREAGRRAAALSASCLVVAPGQLEAGAAFFRARGVRRAVMLGQVLHWRLLRGDAGWDGTLKKIFAGLPDRRAVTLLGALADFFEEGGLVFLPSSHLLEDHFFPAGYRHGRPPDRLAEQSMALGHRVALALAGLDVGLTVVVKDGIVLAVEAIEGTDRTIRRAGRVTRGAVVVKVSRPEQDQRFDLPVIGPVTMRHLARVRAAALAFSAGTLVIERQRVLALATRYNISLAVL